MTVTAVRRSAIACLIAASLASCETTGQSRAPADAEQAIEGRVHAIVASMTLEQKIGQMTQAEIRSVTPDDVRRYYIGSILNGGGAWPGMNKRSTVGDWRKLADAFYQASMSTDMAIKVPVVWGTDAVHGHNNVFGATLFPHNIGLGSANDVGMMERIGRATALQVRETGITWAFAPTLAVVQNTRWGRTYEGYSSDPMLVKAYGRAMVTGLQGRLGASDSVLATAKHWLGDGGTFHGRDQGETRISEAELLSTHAAGYYGALDANVQTVMVSYSSFTDTATGMAWGKMHGNRHLVTDVLKQKLGFNGLVISDWNAIEQVPGCSRDHCPQVINAGVDLVMVPDDWKSFIAKTIADVREGRIPMSRIDDAVSRIVRVKLRSGLFDASPADERPSAGSAVGSPEMQDLAREAVRKSLVLLKNDGGILPLRREGRVLVVGKAADNVPMQVGGWSITWQGDNIDNSDFPNARTLLGALRQTLGVQNVDYSVDGTKVDPSRYSAVVMVASETPYAEMKGDVSFPLSLRHSVRYPEDLAALDRVRGKGAPVVTLLYSGRPVAVNDLIARSDAFVAAWLPGTEGMGLADMIFRAADGSVGFDFKGRLPFDWPGADCVTDNGGWLFRRGFGLSVADRRSTPIPPDAPPPLACPADSR